MGASVAPPLFLDQNETRRAEKKSFGDRPPPPTPTLSQGLDNRAPPYLKVWNRHWVYLFTGGVVTKLSEI